MDIDLNFTCCECGSATGVTVNCSGGDSNAAAVAMVKIPCPTCGSIIRVAFATDGTIHDVDSQVGFLRVLEPSLN